MIRETLVGATREHFIVAVKKPQRVVGPLGFPKRCNKSEKVCGESVKVAQAIQSSGGGSTPASPLHFREAPLEEVSSFVKKNHYSRTHPGGVTHCFVVEMDGFVVGAAMFGYMAGNPKGTALLRDPDNLERFSDPDLYRELMRLVLYDDVPKNSETQFIGWCLRWLKKNTDVAALVSFADPKYGHSGIIYKASNWIYTGLQKPDRPRLIVNGKEIHPRQAVDTYGTSSVSKLKAKGLQVKEEPREPKHRFVFVLRSELKKYLRDWNTNGNKSGA